MHIFTRLVLQLKRGMRQPEATREFFRDGLHQAPRIRIAVDHDMGGQHVAPNERTPLANLHLTLLEKFGIEQPSFADSTGRISEL